nr:Cys-tRNA(Pro) deacylase [Bacillus xiapuensis]
MKIGKTNAMRMLDAANVPYEMHAYENKDGKIDGVSVAEKIGKDPSMVYKTLVTVGSENHLYVFIIPAAEELDLKKAAKAAGEKKLDLLPVKELPKYTGYIRGGCSPIGMKKSYPTFIDKRANELEKVIVSGGKIGVQIELKPKDLIAVTGALSGENLLK